MGKKNILLEGLRTRKPPAEFQDVCLKTFCAVRATLQLEDFNVASLTRRQFAVRRDFHYESWFSFPLLRFRYYLDVAFVLEDSFKDTPRLGLRHPFRSG